MNRFFLIILLAGGFIFFGCQSDPDKPEDLIKEPVYVDLLTEIFLSQSLVELIDDGQQKQDSLYTVLFEHYDVTRDQFDRSHEYYQRQGTKQLARVDTVRERLRIEREALMRARQDQ